MSKSTGPLSGIRVLDLTRMISGPYCTRMLADCGAEVIKVEPLGGEHMRRKEPMRDGASSYFGHLNAGKKSIELDFDSSRDRAALSRLAGGCDVVVENFRPGVTRKIGLDAATLTSRNKGLVYCSISGFGQEGPRASQPAYAPIVHAASGLDMATLACQRGIERPLNTGVYYADLVAGVYAFGAIQTALIGRLRQGRGQVIDLALLDCMINLMVIEVQEAQFPSAHARWMFQPVRAADGFVVVTPVSARNFAELCKALGQEDWQRQDRFATPAARERNWDELMQEIEKWTSRRPAQDCEEILMAAGVPCARYQTVAEVMEDPQIESREVMTRARDEGGEFQLPQLPFKFADNSVRAGAVVAALGSHNRLLDGGSERRGRPAAD